MWDLSREPGAVEEVFFERGVNDLVDDQVVRCDAEGLSIPSISDEGDEEHRNFEYRQHDVHILILGIGLHQYKARQSRAVTVRCGEFVPCSRAIARSR